MVTVARTVLKHGTANGYDKHRCRCDECRAYNTQRQQRWRDRRRSTVETTWSDTVGDDWRQHAACRDKPTAWWFPNSSEYHQRRDEIARAKAICEQCVVKIDCLLWVMQFDQHQIEGIWAGTTKRQRVEIQTKRNRAINREPRHDL